MGTMASKDGPVHPPRHAAGTLTRPFPEFPDSNSAAQPASREGNLGSIAWGLLKISAFALPLCVLLGLFMVAITRWRETAHQARCREHLRQLTLMGLWQLGSEVGSPKGLKLLNGRAEDGLRARIDESQHQFPAATIASSAEAPEKRLSWYVAVLPYLGKEELYQRFELSSAWTSESNRVAALGRLAVVSCPANYRPPQENAPQTTSYVGSAGLGVDAPLLPPTHPRAGLLRYDEVTGSGMIRRGLSYTIALLETHDDPGPWPAGGRPTDRGLDTTQRPYFGPGRQLGGHPAGGHTAFADGSVRFHYQSDSARILERLIPLADTPDP
jgi:hypothetical protein